MPLSAAAAGLIGTGITSALSAASQARTNAQNKKMADQAYQRQRDAIAQQNAYNSPASQVSRLKAAGLSPSLAYGASGELTGQQTDIPEYQPIPAESPIGRGVSADMQNAMRVGFEAREQLNRDNLAIAELAVKDAESFMMVTSAGLNDAQMNEIWTLLGYKEQDYQNKFALDEARYNQIQQEISESMSRIDLNEAQINELDSLVELNGAKASEIYALLPAQLRNMDAQTFMLNAQAGLYNAEIEEVGQKVATLQFNRSLESAKFKFEQVKNKQANERWSAEQRIAIEQGAAERRTSIFRTILGASMLRSGANTSGMRPINYSSVGTGHYGGRKATIIEKPVPGFQPATGKFQYGRRHR